MGISVPQVIQDEFPSLGDVQSQVFKCTPLSKFQDLIPAGCLDPLSYQLHHCYVTEEVNTLLN